MSVDNTEVRVLPEVQMTPELQAAIQAAVSAADVRGLFVAEAEKQLAAKTQLDTDQAAAAQAAADKVAADQAAADAVAKANQIFTRTEIIGGKEFTFQSASEGELDRQVLNAYKVAYSMQQEAPAVVVDPAVQAAADKAAAEADVLAKSELERKFRLGEISVADYMEQSGAVKDYLVKQGLDPNALKEIVEEKAATKHATTEQQSWAAASDTFRTSSVGADWPGGEKNRNLLGNQMAALGLIGATDKVDAMAQAWAAMKTSGAYFPNGDEPVTNATTEAVAAKAAVDAIAAKAAADATAAVAADTARVAVATAKARAMSSSLFNASSGTSGAPIVSPAVIEAKKVIPADATPAEIMQAWKDAQVAGGINPNDAIMNQYRGKAI